jgi:hypothetical protein
LSVVPDRSAAMICHRHGFLKASFVLAISLLASSPLARADQIMVDWSNPDIQKFTQQSKPNFPLATDIASRIAALKLPVLAFDSVPQLVQNASPAGKAPSAPTREVVTDASDPTWYQINDRYGDITISVLASLSINRAMANSAVYQAPTQPAASTPVDPSISVFDSEPDATGVIIEYTVYKFPDIPYTVTIECAQAAKDKCKDLSVVAKDRNLLTLIAAVPPK